MSKADKLLKRVEFYEKMASAQKPEAGDLLNKASLYERLALYSDSKSFLQALAQESISLEQAQEDAGGWSKRPPRDIPPPPPEPFGPSLTGGSSKDYASSPQSNIADYPAQKAPGAALDPIDPKVQEHLSSLVTNRRWGIPLAPIAGKTPFDGRIGRDTRRALDTFKNRMGLPANTPDAQLFQKIESEYAKDNAGQQDFSWMDSAVKQQEQYRQEQADPLNLAKRPKT